MKNQRNDLLMGALIGSAIGAATALILTPLSGDKLRGWIRSYLRGAKGKALSRFEEIVKMSPRKKMQSPTASINRAKKPSANSSVKKRRTIKKEPKTQD